MACGRLGGWVIAVAIASACGLEEEGLAPPVGSGGVSGATPTGGVGPTGGAWSGGTSSGGQSDSGGLAGADGSLTGGAAGAAGAGGAAGVAGTAGASGGAAGAGGSTGGSAGAPPKDCATLFAANPNVVVCPNPPDAQCKLAFGGTFGTFLSCSDVCISVGGTCMQALDDDANQSCVLPGVPAPLDCTYKPNKGVCFCSKPP